MNQPRPDRPAGEAPLTVTPGQCFWSFIESIAYFGSTLIRHDLLGVHRPGDPPTPCIFLQGGHGDYPTDAIGTFVADPPGRILPDERCWIAIRVDLTDIAVLHLYEQHLLKIANHHVPGPVALA